MDNKEYISSLNERFVGKQAEDVLRFFITEYSSKAGLASSLSIEDQVLTDMVCKINGGARIFTLDTGRLFSDTYSLIDKTNMKYGIKIEVFFPDYNNVQKMVAENGMNLFYESVEKRRLCCNVRKIEPLHRAFKGLKVWVCGLRHEQSVTRHDMQVVEWDNENGLIKVNPLINWSEEQVWDYIKSNNVPYNKLHDKGFLSIGCQPCTRAVNSGEDIRAGRWWWESPEHKECGLHRR